MNDKSKKIIKASIIILTLSWYSRVLSAISIVVLARNLTKIDFGILAGCFVVQGFFNILTNVGSGKYLIRKEIITKDDINNAWTINLVSRFFLSFVMFYFSGFASHYIGIPEMEFALKVMSLSPIFMAFINPAINLKIKNLDYSRVSMVEVVSKSVSTTVSISIVLIYQTYWAVIIGNVIFNFSYALGTNYIVKHKLTISTKKIKEQWNFSKWILLKSLVGYVKASFDKITVSRNYSLAELGLYNFSSESASSIFLTLIEPINKVLYPSLSEYVNNKELLYDKLYKYILTLYCFYVPFVFGGVYLSKDLVPIIFGEKWDSAVPLFNIFLTTTLARILFNVLSELLTLIGEVKKQFIYEVVTSTLFVAVISISANNSLFYFSATRMILMYSILLLLMLMLKKLISLSIVKIFYLSFPIVLSSSFMILTIDLIMGNYNIYNELAYVVFSIFIGVISYVSYVVLFSIILKNKINEYHFLYTTFILPILKIFSYKRNL